MSAAVNWPCPNNVPELCFFVVVVVRYYQCFVVRFLKMACTAFLSFQVCACELFNLEARFAVVLKART